MQDTSYNRVVRQRATDLGIRSAYVAMYEGGWGVLIPHGIAAINLEYGALGRSHSRYGARMSLWEMGSRIPVAPAP